MPKRETTGEQTINPRELKSYLLRGGALAFVGKLATAFVGVLLAGLLARLLRPAEMGLYFLSFNLATFFSIIGRGGLENTLLRFIAQANGVGQAARLGSVLRKGLVLTFIGGAIAGLLEALLVPFLDEYLFKSSGLSTIAWILGGWAGLLAIQFVFAEIFRGFQKIGHSVWFGGLFTGVLTVCTLGLAPLLGFKPELKQVLVLILLALLASNGVAMVLHFRKAKALPKAGEGEASYTELLGHSWPLLINAVTLFVLSKSDLWLLGAYGGAQELAIYGAATRLVMLTAMSLAIVNMVVPPIIARMDAQHDLVRLEKVLRTVATIAAIPALAVLAVFMLFAGSIMGLVYGEYYRAGANVLLILCAGQVVNVLVGSCGYVLIMTGHRKTILSISAISAVLAIVLGLYFVQLYGLIGLASAYATATAVQQLAMWICARLQSGMWTHAGLAYLRSIASMKIEPLSLKE